MNTPAHAVINWLILGRGDRPELAVPIVAGSLLPDLSMIVFYIYLKALGTQESVIWSVHYHQRQWQAFFDVFNSIHLILAGLAISWRLRATRWAAFFAGMGLHVLFDLPLHHDDAHRHFFPFSDWRFFSPISYWDPAHYGDIVSACEIVVVAVGSVVLWRRYESMCLRLMCAALALSYSLHWIYVFAVWA
ncbi:MAG: hypothetical protein H0V34_14845 [Gammaproteobacteria bacterium]|nr:hypothetical protein [Gammaproteobacteria bacterium]